MTNPILETVDFAAIRAEFPRAADRLWLAAAENHPFNRSALDALERYTAYRTRGEKAPGCDFTLEMRAETKQMFADLISANRDEIAFVQSTTDGENIVIAGLDLERLGGNVVIDDLHFQATKYMYTQLAEAGKIELRVVPHNNWQVDAEAYADYIDEETRLVSIALVSHINGFKLDVKRISDLAHAKGAYLYADIIQGVGNTPIDVKAMGIDFAATSTYKWLMGEFGLGFLYVDEELQGEIVRKTRYGMRQVESVDDFSFVNAPGAARYQGTGSMPYLQGVIVHAGLKLLSSIGVEAIRDHVRPLTERLQATLPALGYQPITPPGTDTPIVSYVPADLEETKRKLEAAFDHQVISFRTWHQTTEAGEREAVRGIRLAPSVYNNEDDIEQFIAAVS
ncbi:MAG: aminotransferase class V-fold PLP-dependent enzyme [Chloroflexota bacterium]